MLSFDKITLHNFGSYGHAEIDLRDRGFCLVSGENRHKEDAAASNGSGKSFIWSGICFALTGETVQGLKSNLRNIYATDDAAYVRLALSVDGDDFVIERDIAPKSDLKIDKNGVDVSGKGIRESEAKLAELLPDLTSDLISSVIIIGQGMPNRFSAFKPSGRKELLEKLTKSDFMIEDVKARIAARLSALSADMQSTAGAIVSAQAKIDAAKPALSAAKSKLEALDNSDVDAALDKLNAELAALSAAKSETDSGLAKLEADLESANAAWAQAVKSKSDSYEQLSAAYAAKTDGIKSARADANARLNAAKARLKSMAEHPDVCPSCGQKLPNAAHLLEEKAAAEKTFSETFDELTAIEETLRAAELKHKAYVDEIESAFNSTISSAGAKLESLKSELADMRRKASATAGDITIVAARLAAAERDKANLGKERKETADAIFRIESDIAAAEAELKSAQSKYEDLEAHEKRVKNLDTLTKRDFRGYLLDGIIKYLDGKAKEYSALVFGNESLSIAIDGNNLEIEYAGKMFDNLSGGEKQKVDVIIQFAIRDLLLNYLGVGANILVLDEVTDFIDKPGVEAIMRLIERELNAVESVFIISHHVDSLPIIVDSELKVVKGEDGVSRIA